MAYRPRSLFRLIEDINQSVFLPHIQRPFVWNEEQMCRLFDSLMRSYPIQTFLFWRTKDAIKARKFMECIDWNADLSDYYDQNMSRQGAEKVFVLDGQQRLQSLYAIFKGAINLDTNQRSDAYFDVTGGEKPDEDGLLHKLMFFDKDPNNSCFYRISDLLGIDSQRTSEDIAEEINEKLDSTLNEPSDQRRLRERRVRLNLSQLVSILREDRHFWIEELDGVANEFPYKKVLEIFIRVNSGGTKLEAADLMFAAMKEEWDEIEENVENIVELLNTGNLSFDKSFVLKCLLIANDKGAQLTPEKFTGETGRIMLDKIKNNWDVSESAFQQLRDFIINDLKLFSDKVVRSYTSFIPLFDYFQNHKTPNPVEISRMKSYYYQSQLFNWYRSQTDNLLDIVHKRIKDSPCGFPLNEIREYFKNSKGATVKATPDSLKDIRLRFIVLNLVYVETFGTSPFNVKFKGNEPHIDHIYPSSKLKRQLGLDTHEANCLGNYRFVGATDNIRKRAEYPDQYFTRLKNAGIDVSKHLIVAPYASDPTKLVFDVQIYRDFRKKRFDAIFDITSKIVNYES